MTYKKSTEILLGQEHEAESDFFKNPNFKGTINCFATNYENPAFFLNSDLAKSITKLIYQKNKRTFIAKFTLIELKLILIAIAGNH